MTTHDINFAIRSAHYLRSQGLRTNEIVHVLVSELECPPPIASRLASAA